MPPEIQPGLDRRALIRRMAVGGAVVWASPMMQSVASAQATASCGPDIIDWDTFTTGSIFTSTVVGNTTVSITAVALPGTTLFPSNRQVTNGPAGGVNQKYLRFEMLPNAVGRQQTITITFSNPVTNLSLTLFDIDAVTNAWRDEVWIENNAGYTWNIPAGSSVVKGTGVNIDRFRNNNTNNNTPETDNDGNVTLGHPGPLTTFTIRYINGSQSGGQNQWIGMSDLTFQC
jgi:hypothetical protein